MALSMIPQIGEIRTKLTEAQTGSYCGDSHFSRSPTVLPNRQLSRCLGRRFSILDECANDSITWCHIQYPVARAFPPSKSKRRCPLLLALYPHRILCQATLPNLPTNLRQASPILHCILYWIWTVMGGIWIGVVGAEEEEYIPGH